MKLTPHSDATLILKTAFPLILPQIISLQSCGPLSSWLCPPDRGKNRGPERRDQKVTVLEAKGDRPDLALAPLPHLVWHPWPPLSIQTSYLPALSLGCKPYPRLLKGGSASSTSPIYPQNLAQSKLAHWALQGRGCGQIHGRVPRVLSNTILSGSRQQRLPGGGW